MSYLKIADGYLNDIASAIQTQLKLSEPMPVTAMAEKILSIPVNGNFKYILAGTYKDIELIVINDCSTDNTEKIAMEIAKKDERVKVIKTSVNSGVGGARCEGLKIAKGDYIFLCFRKLCLFFSYQLYQ